MHISSNWRRLMGQNRANNDRRRKLFAANAQAAWSGSIQSLADKTGLPYTLCRRWMKRGVSHVSKGDQRGNETHLETFARELGFWSSPELWWSSDKWEALETTKTWMTQQHGVECDSECEQQLRQVITCNFSYIAVHMVAVEYIRGLNEQSRKDTTNAKATMPQADLNSSPLSRFRNKTEAEEPN